MLSRSNTVILTLAVLAAVAGGYVQHRGRMSANTGAMLPGQSLPAMALPDLDGTMHLLADYRGRRLLLNFWASWCGPCLAEMPALDRAQEKFGQRVAIVGIAMEDDTRIRPFLAKHPVAYPMLLGQLAAPSTSLQLGDAGEVLPYSVLVDAQGQVLATHAGALSALQIDQWLDGDLRQP